MKNILGRIMWRMSTSELQFYLFYRNPLASAQQTEEFLSQIPLGTNLEIHNDQLMSCRSYYLSQLYDNMLTIIKVYDIPFKLKTTGDKL